MKDRIKKLQKEKDVAILAHYYVDGEVQKIADYVGDSFYLAKTATKLKNKTIIMAGVYCLCWLSYGTYDNYKKNKRDERKIWWFSSSLLYKFNSRN